MIPQFDEVLLTAYLDNEVTDLERANVEEQQPFVSGFGRLGDHQIEM